MFSVWRDGTRGFNRPFRLVFLTSTTQSCTFARTQIEQGQNVGSLEDCCGALHMLPSAQAISVASSQSAKKQLCPVPTNPAA